MFEKRLTWFWLLLTAVAVLIIGRLVQIQVVQAEDYQQLADRILSLPVQYIGAPRGTVRDRHGTPLLSTEPGFNISIHYALLEDPAEPRASYLREAARRLRKRGHFPDTQTLAEIAPIITTELLPTFWQRLSDLTNTPIDELYERAATIRTRVERIRAVVQRSSPNVRQIAEEQDHLPLLTNINNETALNVRLEMEHLPWLRVEPDSYRTAQNADTLVHLLGRTGQASAERIVQDPLRGDELRQLRPGDQCGTSGVERLAETSLRGTRGRVVLDFDGTEVSRTHAIPGRDVFLTIDLDLQEHVLNLLEQAVANRPDPAGAAAVVIDVESREILALVSYPTYHYDTFSEDYDDLRRDAKRLPLMFRAVQAQYPPGSICKAITLIAGLSENVITPHTRIHCTGYLLPSQPNRFRCWIYNMHPGVTHDMTDDPNGQTGESAVRNSCNIYFFKVGGMLGPQRLCEWFSRFGMGQTTGTGLIEESPAIVPDEQWMHHHGRDHRASDAWNFSIGQGEVTITPVQAANVVASVATGEWQPVRLAYDDQGRAFGAPPAPPRAFNEDHLRVLRRGMWRVVNEQGGTATRARIDVPDHELCGKTGSAQTQPRPVLYRYTYEWPDGTRAQRFAYVEDDALATFGDEKPKRVGRHTAQRYPAIPEGGKLPAHAWFVGFTQSKATPRGERPLGKCYGISVLIEFGGSGGRVAGPVAKQIAEYLLTTPEANE